jgi:hypothetical protein
MMKDNPISTSINFDKNGIQHGFLKVPYSINKSAWGAVMIPITQFKNGDGPSYSSPWLAPVNIAEGPSPFLNCVIGIITAPQADLLLE